MGGRSLNKLSALRVSRATEPGRYGDGGGLYLVISANGARKWVFRYTAAGTQRDMGLGSAAEVSLAHARDLRDLAREHLRFGRDPLAERRREKAEALAIPTFGEMADQLLESIEGGFRNEKHRAQWRMTLTEYAKPLRAKPVNEIASDDVLKVLTPIWQSKAETASRLRGRIERVLDAAKAKGLRGGENPARWRGHLDTLLSKRSKLSRGHHAAMAFADVPAFLTKLRAQEGFAARTLEFTILTAARSGEALGARWSEIDLQRRVWTVPAARMKAGREHRVPLSERALAILNERLAEKSGEFIFPGAKQNSPQSNMALAMVLRRMNVNVTVHGFRSSFRDWVGESTHFPREVAEAALAHVFGDETERAYRRGDALGKRRELMASWAGYCNGESGVVLVMSNIA